MSSLRVMCNLWVLRMILTIDCGNTNIVVGVFSAEATEQSATPLFEWRIPTKPQRSFAELRDEMLACFNREMPQQDYQFTGAIIANVVPAYQKNLVDVAHHICSGPVFSLQDKHLRLPMDIDVIAPEEVGEDRLVNVAGLKQDEKPAIIVDFGTATTLDLVRCSDYQQKPIYAGGIIAPGVHRSVEALVAAAAQLKPIEIKAFEPDLPILGRNTDQAMRSGIYWGYVSLISGLIDRLQQHHQSPLCVIATGGLASVFAPHIPKISKIDRHLTLRGLYHIYQYNNVS